MDYRLKQLVRDNRGLRLHVWLVLAGSAGPLLAVDIAGEIGCHRDSVIDALRAMERDGYTAALQELLYRELRFDLPGRTSGETDATWRKASVDERGGMIADVLLKKHVGLASWSVPGVDVVTKKVTALAKAAGVKLPRGWDAAPSANSKPQTPKPKGAKKKR